MDVLELLKEKPIISSGYTAILHMHTITEDIEIKTLLQVTETDEKGERSITNVRSQPAINTEGKYRVVQPASKRPQTQGNAFRRRPDSLPEPQQLENKVSPANEQSQTEESAMPRVEAKLRQIDKNKPRSESKQSKTLNPSQNRISRARINSNAAKKDRCVANFSLGDPKLAQHIVFETPNNDPTRYKFSDFSERNKLLV